MKRWSLHVGTFGGTEVRLHATFLLLLGLLGWITLANHGPAAALDTVAFVIAIFFCVLLHEFGHVIAARRFGIQTTDVTLLPIGGLARLERMPRKPTQELVVALAGPAVNVAIFLAIWPFLRFVPSPTVDYDMMRAPFFERLAYWNLIMVVFNMIPAFPMDGGRVLRAALAHFMEYANATRIAASIGQTIAVFAGVYFLFVLQNPVIVIIAIFIFLGAGQEAAYVSDQEAMRGLRVSDAMLTEFRTLPQGAVLQDAVDLLLAGTQHDFPVLDEEGQVHGMLSRTSLINGLAQHGAQQSVSAVIVPCETTLKPYHPLPDAVELLRSSACPALPVQDPLSGKLLGLLTLENIGEMMMVRAALGQGRQTTT
ncbi:Zn-dependent protease [Roseimicrobium gellanilyticum]|uniref:Zinc metalloprotease n=1 Tax=Roseimicrobium gellanilyticum TaxID=748857 RepID=A0A366H0X1_9BACT|nr:site-2 protease family protein [Roseimicrobium gellanilyticum]RBP35507.1 Zn-dependent protease [Roseimicrobium gellanilyticum]